MRKSRRLPQLFPVLVALAGGLAVPAFAAMPTPPALAPVAAQALPAVVSVESIDPMKAPPHPGVQPAAAHSQPADTNTLIVPPRAEQALGSGFIISPRGYIVTNHHVIAGASEIRVTLQDGRVYPAKLVGADAKADLAVLKIKAGRKLPFLKFGDSGKLADGDLVMAIGNPFGLSFSVTAGIVSALHRDIGSGPYDDFIQTDAAINRGNSGGPLLNQQGEVVGIDTAIYSPAGGSVGIGFAIPSSMIRPVAAALRAHGRMSRGWAGLRVEQVTREMADAWKLGSTQGVVVAGVVADGPAARDLQPGDVVLRINGHRIIDTQPFTVALGEVAAGNQARLAYWRNGAVHHAVLTIAAMPQDAKPKPAIATASPAVTINGLGLSVAAHPQAPGVLVTGVVKDGPAAKAGIGASVLIEAVGPDFVATPEALQKAVADQAGRGVASLTLLIDRPDGASWIPVQLPQKPAPAGATAKMRQPS